MAEIMLCGVHTLQVPSAQVKLSDSSKLQRGETKPKQVGTVKQLGIYTVTKVISEGRLNGFVELKHLGWQMVVVHNLHLL
jgi:hypothetical protein